MPQPQFVVEAVDVRRATATGNDRTLTIQKVVFPEIKQKQTAFAPGGGVGEVNHRLPQIEPLSPKFEVKGIDQDVLRQFGFAGGIADKWTFAAAVREKGTSRLLPLRATIQGVISTWTPDEHSTGDLHGCNYEMIEVVYYEYTLDGETLFLWDYYNRIYKTNGVDVFADIRNALGA